MNKIVNSLALIVAFSAAVGCSTGAQAQTQITDFNIFFEDELYASWADPSAVIDSGLESYTITATGYGSNYTYIGHLGILGAGNTHLELEVSLSGPPEADGHLGPIVSLIDLDGSYYNYAWYGQPLGDHVLTMPLASPTWISAPGTVPGLDLDNLEHMHLQLDPGGFGTMGAYTVEWKNLRLIEVVGIPGDFDGDGDVDGHDLLLWQRDTGIGSLAEWETNFGTVGGALTGQFHAVPEPSAGLVLLGCMSLLLPGRFWYTK